MPPSAPLAETDSIAANTAAVRLKQVSLLYGRFVALRNISMSIPRGASVVLLGENGAGKSTLLKLIAGLATPSFGEVCVLGQPPRNQRGLIATMGHASQLYDELTAMENLTYFGSLYGIAPQSCEQALREVALDPENSRRVGEYSQGMRQRASLARALLSQPEVLLLDEPFSNLDAASARSMIERLQQWIVEPGASGRFRTLILTTHQAELARPLASMIVTLHEGRLASVTEAGRA